MPKKKPKKTFKDYPTHILKLDKHDEKKEIEFEVRHQMTLTTQERFEAMLTFSMEMMKLARRHGYNATPHIVKRA